jgi:competence protein ComEC
LRAACGRLPPDERGLVPGLVVGDVSRMPPSLTDAFRTSGLTHLNAVSGENCAVVLGAVVFAARRSGLGRRQRLVLCAVALAAFVVLARPSPSVLRAAVMGAATLTAAALGRRPQPLALLSLAVLVLVLVDPFLSRQVGFALSVAATAAIVLAAPALTRTLSRSLPRPLAAAIAVSVAAQLACTPLLVAVFGQLTPWAIPANLAAAPAVPPATVLGVLAAVVAVPLPPVASLLAWAAAVPAAWLALVARGFASMPGSGLHGPTGLPGLLLVTSVAVVAALAWRVRPHVRRAMLGAWPA